MDRKIAAVIVDTHDDKQLPILAIEKTIQCKKINRVYTLSDVPYYQGAEFFKIPKITSIKDYEYWVLGGVLDFCDQDILVIQWDGFVLHPQNWKDQYFQYDYIGAPHDYGTGFVVGNGGFSFRSQKLLSELRELLAQSNGRLLEDVPEDIFISKNHAALAEKGIRFPSLEIAHTFAYQDGFRSFKDFRTDLFGFHSPWNFPNFFEEESLILLAEKILSRISNFGILTTYLSQVKGHGMSELFIQSINSIDKNPKLVKLIDKSLSDPLDKFHSFAPTFIKIMGG